MRRYLVVFEKTVSVYSAYVPDLPGCVATGPDKKAVDQTIYEAIRFHLEGMKEENLKIPDGNAEGEILVFS